MLGDCSHTSPVSWSKDSITSRAKRYKPHGRYEEAAKYAIRRAELRPNDFFSNFGAWNILANRAQEPARARPYLLRARKLASEENLKADLFGAVWFPLSSAMDDWQLGEVAQALSEVNRVAQTINARAGDLREALASRVGDSYLTLGKLKLAEEVGQNVRGKIGSVAFARGDMVALRALGANSRRATGSPVFAIFLLRAGLLPQAQKELSAMEKQKMNRGFVKVVQGEMALARGRRAAAISLLRESIREIPAFTGTRLLGAESLAGALEQNGELPQAIQVLAPISDFDIISRWVVGSFDLETFEKGQSSDLAWTVINWHGDFGTTAEDKRVPVPKGFTLGFPPGSRRPKAKPETKAPVAPGGLKKRGAEPQEHVAISSASLSYESLSPSLASLFAGTIRGTGRPNKI